VSRAERDGGGGVALAERAPLIGVALPSILAHLTARVPQIQRRLPATPAPVVVDVVDVDHMVLGVIEPRRGPIADIAISDDGRQLFVTHYGRDTVSAVNTKSWVVEPIGEMTEPFGIAMSPVGDGRAYVAAVADSGSYDSVAVIDTDVRTVIAAHPLALEARHLRVSPDGKRVYVAGSGRDGAEVAVVDVITSEVTVIGLAGTAAVDLCLAAEGDRLYVATAGPGTGGELVVIDVEANRIVTSIESSSPIRAVAVDPDETCVYVLRYDDVRGGVLSVVDAASTDVVRTIEIGGSPGSVAISADGALAYLADAGQVDVVRLSNGELIDVLVPGTEPAAVAVSPNGGRLYVADHDGRITAIAVRTR
jgi:DNA-binding beta-propeller fold protein YncE